MILGTKYKTKPSVAARLIPGHRLADGLVGCWLLNEGAGLKGFDISGCRNDATFRGSAGWRSSRLGPAMDSQSSGNNAGTTFNGTQYSDLSISAWVIPDDVASTRYILDNSPGSTGFGFRQNGTQLDFFCFSGGAAGLVSKTGFFSAGQLRHVAAVHNSKNIIYGDGVYLNEAASAIGIDDSAEQMGIGGDYLGAYGWDGAIVLVQIWSRSLSAAEIAWLYREPFAMFNRPGRTELMYAPTTAVVSLAGASSGESGASGSIGLTRRLAGSASAHAAAAAEIGVAGESPGVAPQRTWLKEALFAGMTANAFKLGTTLSLGWFWMRVEGCSALYRGGSMSCIGFESILSVGNPDAGFISPPGCIPHDSSSTYFYVVRRFNRCGVREDTLAGAVKVAIDANADLAAPQPNGIFSSTAATAEGDKVRLTWFYSPLEQKSGPARFNIYCDNRTGEIDYESPIALISYKGRRFYSYKSGALTAGRYLFAIRAQDIDGAENGSLGLLRIQVSAASPDAIDIVSVEAV
jgi:hypothetical protein